MIGIKIIVSLLYIGIPARNAPTAHTAPTAQHTLFFDDIIFSFCPLTVAPYNIIVDNNLRPGLS